MDLWSQRASLLHLQPGVLWRHGCLWQPGCKYSFYLISSKYIYCFMIDIDGIIRPESLRCFYLLTSNIIVIICQAKQWIRFNLMFSFYVFSVLTSGSTTRVSASPPHRKENGTAHNARLICVATVPTERTELSTSDDVTASCLISYRYYAINLPVYLIH